MTNRIDCVIIIKLCITFGFRTYTKDSRYKNCLTVFIMKPPAEGNRAFSNEDRGVFVLFAVNLSVRPRLSSGTGVFVSCEMILNFRGETIMPSKAILEQKQAMVSELSDRLKGACAGVIVNYSGITVEDDTKLRKQLREAGVVYTVAKNTLIKRAAADAGVEIDDAVLNGTTAIATCESDYIAAAKILNDYAKGSTKGFEIKAGFIDGKKMTVDEVKTLAKTPSRETLLTQLAFGLNATIQGLAIAIKAIVDKQTEGAEAPAADEAPAAE